MPIVKMSRHHASYVARLHCDSIPGGLTRWLGQRFCEKLYWAMACTPYSFVLVHEDQQHNPLGFICCATNTSKMYKTIVFRHFFALSFSSIMKFLDPSVIKQVLTSINRPRKFKAGDLSKLDLPEAEVVSIAVSPKAQGKHIGTNLLQAALEHFKSMGHQRIRVWTTEDNEQALAFYQKHGFKLLGCSQHHTGGIRVFVIDLSDPDESLS